jgi:hypothetical protein
MNAAEAKNAGALLAAGGDVNAVCDQCHSKYWKEGAEH